jgi:hypothetical protein
MTTTEEDIGSNRFTVRVGEPKDELSDVQCRIDAMKRAIREMTVAAEDAGNPHEMPVGTLWVFSYELESIHARIELLIKQQMRSTEVH